MSYSVKKVLLLFFVVVILVGLVGCVIEIFIVLLV